MDDAQSIVKALWMLPQGWNIKAEGPNSDEDLVLQPGDSPRELLSCRVNQDLFTALHCLGLPVLTNSGSGIYTNTTKRRA